MVFTESAPVCADLGPRHLLDADASASFGDLPGRVCLFFQPIFELRSRQIVGCEALLRWWHPEYGMLGPHAALSGTRWSGLLADMERWAIDDVCRRGAEWTAEGHPIQVTLNLGREQLADAGLPATLRRAVDAHGSARPQLAVDVPAAAVAMDPVGVVRAMEAIADAGIEVHLDGVSSAMQMALLDRLPATTWKIDLWSPTRRRPGFHPFVDATLHRAERIGVTTVAKAVGDVGQLRLVEQLGFDRAFGRTLSPPLTHRAMRARLRSRADDGRPTRTTRALGPRLRAARRR